MALPGVIRVKRRCDETPAEALLLACKRIKHEGDISEDASMTVLKFAGTVKDQSESVHVHLKKISLSKNELKENFKHHTPKITEKLREQLKHQAHEDRFKIVNLQRFCGGLENESHVVNIDDTPSCSKTAEENFTILDIERRTPEIGESSSSLKVKEEKGYEFDLYYSNIPDALENIESIHPYSGDIFLNAKEEDEVSNGESEDSNDENNWRNDYPDSDPDKSSSDEDLLDKMARCGIGSGEELSDDDGEEDFVYGNDQQPDSPFARYKARNMCNYTLSSSSSSSDEIIDSAGVNIQEVP